MPGGLGCKVDEYRSLRGSPSWLGVRETAQAQCGGCKVSEKAEIPVHSVNQGGLPGGAGL